jgi:hypothetical protein
MNLGKTQMRMSKLLTDFRFAPIRDAVLLINKVHQEKMFSLA